MSNRKLYLYAAKLKLAKVMAYISTVMYSFNWFLGFCALTWASAVILGGLLTALTWSDYYSVLALLLLEAGRLSTTTFFGKVGTLELGYFDSADPEQISFSAHYSHTLLGLLAILSRAVQLTMLAISIVIPIDRLMHLNSLHSAPGDGDFETLVTSLRIFYVLVLVNGSISMVALMFAKHVVPIFLDSISLRKYYEKIVWKGMDEGLLHVTELEFFSWTFEVQANEYRCWMRASVVGKMYKDMMTFLYYHPNHMGFEAAEVALDSSDTFVREAAANIVGLWAKLVTAEKESNGTTVPVKQQISDSRIMSAASGMKAGDKEPKDENGKWELTRLLMQTKLLAKLAEALGNNQEGRAASSSFLGLASIAPECVLKVRSEGKDEMVMDIMMDQIHKFVEMERPKNYALIYIKALIPLLDYLRKSSDLQKCMILVLKSERERSELEVGKYCTPAKLGRLKEDVWTIVSKDPSVLKRLQAVAAYVYYLLLSDDERNDEKNCRELLNYLRQMPQNRNTHILIDEQEYLFTLLKEPELPSAWKDFVKVRQFEGERTYVITFWARRSTALIASFVSFVILFISSIFILMYASF